MNERDKFQTLIDALGITVYQFGKDLGFARVEPIYKILRGDTKDPGSSMYAKIKKRYPQVNTDWLVTGEGSIFIQTGSELENKLQQKVEELVVENKVLQNMYRRASAEIESMGKTKGVSISPDFVIAKHKRESANKAIQNVRRADRKRVSKPMSVHVQGVKIPSLIDLFQQ